MFIILCLCLCLIVIFVIFYGKSCKKEKFYTYDYDRTHVDDLLTKKATKILGTSITPIYIIDNFLPDEYCEYIIHTCDNKMEPSPLTRYDPNDPDFRTSKTCYFEGEEIQNELEDYMIETLGVDDLKCESSQLQHYLVGNEFKAHYDYFDPDVDPSFLKNGQRSWTFMVYLNDVTKGGTTNFPELNEVIYPKKGRAVIWCNITADKKLDSNTLHQGSPVEEGEKWIITKWFLDGKKL